MQHWLHWDDWWFEMMKWTLDLNLSARDGRRIYKSISGGYAGKNRRVGGQIYCNAFCFRVFENVVIMLRPGPELGKRTNAKMLYFRLFKQTDAELMKRRTWSPIVDLNVDWILVDVDWILEGNFERFFDESVLQFWQFVEFQGNWKMNNIYNNCYITEFFHLNWILNNSIYLS